MTNILSLNSQKQRPEPFEGAEITANPEEVHLVESCLLLRIVTPVPDTLQDRCEGRDTNTGSNENRNFVFENVLRCRSKWSINVNYRQSISNVLFVPL